MKKLIFSLMLIACAFLFVGCGEEQQVETKIEINYTYGGQFFGDATITAKMDGWYSNGTQVVFACGGAIYTSALEAAKKVEGGKVIGVDVDQSYIDPIIITSAMKGLQSSVETALGKYFAGKWNEIGGTTAKLGLAKEADGIDYVGIPEADGSWRFNKFTKAQYDAVLAKVRADLEVVQQPVGTGKGLTAGNKIALVTDVGTIDDESFNQAAWQGVKAYGDANSIEYTYYQPSADSKEARLTSIGKAVEEGASVIVCPGFLFEETIYDCQKLYPEVAFILLDGEPHDAAYNYETAENVYCVLYQEEQAGFLAGYAAVMDGYTKLGFLGGMDVPAVIRFGYGFVQGCDYAIQELEGKAPEKLVISSNSDKDVKPTVSGYTKVNYIN